MDHGNKLCKLGQLLNNAYSFGKMPLHCSASDIAVLQIAYYHVSDNKPCEFLEKNVKTILEQIGFCVRQTEIGWTVEP